VIIVQTLLTFWLDGSKFACQLEAMQRVIWAVEITPLPGQTDKVKGVINLEDQVVPIVDLRQIVGLPTRAIELDDDIVIANSEYGPVGMIVDGVAGVAEYPDSEFEPITEAVKSFACGVLKTNSDLIIVVDPTKMINEGDLPDVSELKLAEAV
jgi:purine-binding chemotaxis protein CheW